MQVDLRLLVMLRTRAVVVRATRNYLRRLDASVPKLAPQTRVAFSSIILNTGSSSPGELLITLRTSAVAVCCQRSEIARPACISSNSRDVLDGDHGLIGEGLQQTDLSCRQRILASRRVMPIVPIAIPLRSIGTTSMLRQPTRPRKFLDVLREIGSVNIGDDCKFSGSRDPGVNAR